VLEPGIETYTSGIA